jgi:hypothetical protein
MEEEEDYATVTLTFSSLFYFPIGNAQFEFGFTLSSSGEPDITLLSPSKTKFRNLN